MQGCMRALSLKYYSSSYLYIYIYPYIRIYPYVPTLGPTRLRFAFCVLSLAFCQPATVQVLSPIYPDPLKDPKNGTPPI